ncbi:hypothetical protein VTK73DRAFT_6956 [Phialemonium thermophilum]|uniref:Uncharacterized protein n=1 Tax=Phialemonium thermophilum TaxID=223376 RepID=A0ABR3XV32_9PEZI
MKYAHLDPNSGGGRAMRNEVLSGMASLGFEIALAKRSITTTGFHSAISLTRSIQYHHVSLKGGSPKSSGKYPLLEVRSLTGCLPSRTPIQKARDMIRRSTLSPDALI